MDSRKLALLCRELADNKKAEHITILDVREISSVTDYFVIASGTANRISARLWMKSRTKSGKTMD